MTGQGNVGSQLMANYKAPMLAAGASMLMPQTPNKPPAAFNNPNAPTPLIDPNYQAYRSYNPSARAPDSSAERMYYAKDGGLMFADGGFTAGGPPGNGPVEQMSYQNTVGNNTKYPMANINMPSYAVPSANPVSENVIRPQGDDNVDPNSGVDRFADGGPAKSENILDVLRRLLGNGMPKPDPNKAPWDPNYQAYGIQDPYQNPRIM